ncbi:MAG: hypothetical protein ACREGD_04815 [Candidatus Saccharimonadales bacterium]
MYAKAVTKLKKLTPQQRMIVGGLLVVILIGIFLLTRPPERSVAAYCKVYIEENAKLPHEGGDKHKAGVFTSSINDPGKFATAYSKLERVAPEEIRHDVKTLKSVFEKIDSDPSQTLNAGLSGLGASMEIEGWTKENCR